MQTFLISLAFTTILILVLRASANHLGMLDHPDERKQHAHPIPTVGGMAMFVATASSLFFHAQPTHSEIVLLISAAVLVILGTLDDKHNLSVRLRMLVQVTVALAVITGAEGVITQLGKIAGWPLQLGFMSIPFTLIGFVGAINAMNMIDGADGMAGSMALITLIGLSVLFVLSPGSDTSLDLHLALIGALCGFLLFNSRLFLRRALVFMGDAGSMWLGLVLAWMLAQLSQNKMADPWVVLWLFGLPLIDTLTVMFRRIHKKKSPFVADRTHIHHIFEQHGFSTAHSVLLSALGQVFLVSMGVVFYLTQAPTLIVLGSFLLIFASYFFALRHRPAKSRRNN